MKIIKQLLLILVLMIVGIAYTPVVYAVESGPDSDCIQFDKENLLTVEFYEPIEPLPKDSKDYVQIGYDGMKCEAVSGGGRGSNPECYRCVFENHDKCISETRKYLNDEEPIGYCHRVQILKAKTSAQLIGRYISFIYKWGASIIGIVGVLIIVYSGIEISASAGDSSKLDAAKNRIFQSIVAIIVVFLSGLILYTINPTFFVK